MSYNQHSLEGRIRELEDKIELLLIIAKDVLELRVTDEEEKKKSEVKERLGDLDRVIQSSISGKYASYRDSQNLYADSEQRAPGVKVFGVDVDDTGSFHFTPQYWNYPAGSKVQWTSKTGSFTVHIDAQDYPEELGSPFDNQWDLQSHKDPEDNLWKTDVVPVRSVFSETGRAVRRLAGVRPSKHTFTIALERGGRVFVDRTRNGSTTC